MRIVHVIESLGLGGAEVMLSEVLPRLAQRGHEVRVVALAEPATLRATLEDAGIRTSVLSGSALSKAQLPRAACRLNRVLREAPADVVHTHLFQASVATRLAVAAMPRQRPRIVTSLHNPDYGGLRLEGVAGHKIAALQAMDWVSCVAANDALVAVSRAVARDYAHHLGQRGVFGRVQVIHNAIDTERLARSVDAIDAVAARESWGVREDQFLVVSIGRLTFQKNFPMLIAAMRRLRSSGVDAVALVLGGGAQLDSLAASAPDHVRFVGSQARPRVLDALAACDVYVQPSRYEAFGIAILEAMAASRAVVGTDVDGIPEVVEDGVTGLLVPDGDEGGLAEVLGHLARSRDTRAAMATAGRARAVRLFDIERWVDQTEALYQRLVHQRSPS